jgi:hypothetical protein
MQLSPPERTTWSLSILPGIVAVIAQAIVDLPLIIPYAFWILVLAFILLALGTLLPGI